MQRYGPLCTRSGFVLQPMAGFWIFGTADLSTFAALNQLEITSDVQC